jgi:uncharacterized protein (TIGR03083 family)
MIEIQTLTLEQAHTRGFELVQEHTQRFVDFVRRLPAGSADRPVEGSDWTVGEVVAHVQSVYLRYTQVGRRSATPKGVAQQNAEEIAPLGTDLAAATASILDQLPTMEPRVALVAPDATFPFHAGQRATLTAGWGNLLGELLAHGDDIARATGTDFAIPGPDLEILWRWTAPMLQGWLRPAAKGTCESWRLAFPFGPIGVLLDHGQLRWGTDLTARADHVVEVDDTVELTLSFPYRRRVIRDPALALLANRFYDV